MKNSLFLNALLLSSVCLFFLSACSQNKTWEELCADGDRMEEASRNKRVALTFEEFIAGEDYRSSRDMWRGAALGQYAPADSHVEILLEEQRGRLYIHGNIAMDFPICSGRFGGSETPKGTFRISQKVRDYRSNLYGAYVDAQGRVVKSGADSREKGPVGTVFRGASMPYWMRFNGAIGLHVGHVYRDGQSHGCVRVPEEACSILFSRLDVGSKVIVK